jgi:hypothetical protein
MATDIETAAAEAGLGKNPILLQAGQNLLLLFEN